MRIHVVSLPHTQTTREFVWCAYTEKVRKFCNMMHDLGHTVFLYAGEDNEARCTEHVPLITKDDIRGWFPTWDAETDVWPGWITGASWWTTMNDRAFTAISERHQPGDYLGLIAGICQQPLADRLPTLPSVEWGIGYSGVFASYRVFESYAWMHYMAARLETCGGTDDIRFYDAVIPNSFDLLDYVRSETHDDYLLYLGRLTERKGMRVVQDIVRAGHTVMIAGQGDVRIDGAAQMGVVRGQVKANLLAKAKAVLVPTTYLEPFGGVAVEAMLSGTPVISTDWGAFTETVQHGTTGFRCRTFGEFLGAIDLVDSLDRDAIFRYARSRYATDVVGVQYDAYFAQLDEVYGRRGWYETDGPVRAGIGSRYWT